MFSHVLASMFVVQGSYTFWANGSDKLEKTFLLLTKNIKITQNITENKLINKSNKEA